MPGWIHVDHKYLQLAMKEYARLGGVVGAREKFGFSPANRVLMYYGGNGPYEARVLVAIAHSLQSPSKPKLTPKSFTGYGNLASKWLARNGFEERRIAYEPKSARPQYLRAA